MALGGGPARLRTGRARRRLSSSPPPRRPGSAPFPALRAERPGRTRPPRSHSALCAGLSAGRRPHGRRRASFRELRHAPPRGPGRSRRPRRSEAAALGGVAGFPPPPCARAALRGDVAPRSCPEDPRPCPLVSPRLSPLPKARRTALPKPKWKDPETRRTTADMGSSRRVTAALAVFCHCPPTRR